MMYKTEGNFHAQYNGFQITFDNGFMISVQWNSGNYCEVRHHPETRNQINDSRTAEVGVFQVSKQTKSMFDLGAPEWEIHGYCNSAEVAALITATALRTI